MLLALATYTALNLLHVNEETDDIMLFTDLHMYAW